MLIAIIFVVGLTMCSMSMATLAACAVRRRSMRKLERAERRRSMDQISAINKKLSIDTQRLSFDRRAWKGWRNLVIDRICDETDNCKSFELIDPEGQPLPPFLPGQYLTIKIGLSAKDSIQRCYSLSDAPNWKRYRISVKRVPSGRGSGWLHDLAEVGTSLSVRAPAGRFIANPRVAQPLVLIGAGIGITPLLSILKSVRLTQPVREIDLYYQVRDLENAALLREIAESIADHPPARLHLYVTRPPKVIPAWIAGTGRLRVEQVYSPGQISDNEKQPQYMICGPAAMIDGFRDGLLNLGIEPSNITTETFLPSQAVPASNVLGNVPVADNERKSDSIAHEVRFAMSNAIGNCNEQVPTLLDAAESAGVTLDSSCRSGECGTCVVKKLSGRIFYFRPPGFSDLGKDEVLACVAQPLESVVLDL